MRFGRSVSKDILLISSAVIVGKVEESVQVLNILGQGGFSLRSVVLTFFN